jgi:hypothetical protein
VTVAVVNMMSRAGGSPRIATLSEPPFFMSAAGAAVSAALASGWLGWRYSGRGRGWPAGCRQWEDGLSHAHRGDVFQQPPPRDRLIQNATLLRFVTTMPSHHTHLQIRSRGPLRAHWQD